MTQSTRHGSLFVLVVGLCFLTVPGVVYADLIVDATVSPILGGFHFGYSITNNESVDVAIVSIVGPVGDPLIGPTLTAPNGFLASYDSGLGFIDFLENTSSFLSGTTTSGFGFDSASPPGPTTFSALTVTGGRLEGLTEAPVGVPVPEPGIIILLMAGVSALAGFRAHLSMRYR